MTWGEIATRAIHEVRGYMEGQEFPQMRRPLGFGQEYSFPSDPSELTSMLLGRLQLQLQGYHSHALRVLGEMDGELGLVEGPYEIALGIECQRIQDSRGTGKGSRVVKDNLVALAINGHVGLKETYEVILKQKAKVRRLETQAAIYHDQLQRLSREQSRREMETRVA